MIAIAIACEPKLLIADEPTTALDVTVQAQVLALIDSLRRDMGLACLLITHDLAVVSSVCDRALVMYAGRSVEEAPVKALFAQPRHRYTRALIDTIPARNPPGTRLPAIAGQVPAPARGAQAARSCSVAPHRWSAAAARSRHCSGRATPTGLLEPGAMTAMVNTPLLQVIDLHKSYTHRHGGVVHAVRGVSLEVTAGSVLGIVGESGCGKTTLGRTIMRLMEPDRGRILIAGEDFCRQTRGSAQAARRDMQMVFQDPFGSLNPRHTIGTIIAEPLIVQGVPDASARVRELLDLVGLPASASAQYPHEFSGGQRQRIAIARALALKPKLIIADEPVSALDVSIQSQIINLIADLRQQFGLAMIFISHDLSVIRHVSDRIAVMHNGQIVETGDTQAVFASPQHAYTRTLMAAIPRFTA